MPPVPRHFVPLTAWFSSAGNHVGAEAAQALADGLRSNSTLRTLNLEGVRMRDLSAQKGLY